MLISKFDLYKSEWLELVFDDRNKAYGAYELRQHYPRTMVRAMLITFLTIVALIIGLGVILKPVIIKAADKFKVTVVPLINVVQPPEAPKPPAEHHVKAAVTPALPATPSTMHKFIPLVVTEDKKAPVDPPEMKDLTTGVIGTANIKVPGNSPASNAGPATAPAGGNGTGVVSDFHSLEQMPEPYGGASAWSKFLNKTLRYPDMAIDQHMQGKVWVSFVVEKDGSLTDFKVERGIGYGLDEEALRVLKLAPAWKPGIQNGQPVRVKYNIAINFQLTDEQ